MRVLWRVLSKLSAVLALLVVSFYVALYLWSRQGPVELARQRQLLQQDGIPLTAAALLPPLPPRDQDAAPDYVRLTALLKKKPLSGDQELLISRSTGAHSPLTTDRAAAVRALLQQRADVIQLIHQAVRKPRCAFRRDWSLGPYLLFHDYASMREAARLLSAESYLLAKEGHYDQAIRNQALVFRLTDHIGTEPGVIAYLVAIACDHLAIAGMEDILRMAGPNARVSAEVFDTVNLHRPHLDPRRALEGEVLMALALRRILLGRPVSDGTLGPSLVHEDADPRWRTPAKGQESANNVIAKNLYDYGVAGELRYLRILMDDTRLPEAQQAAAFEAVVDSVKREARSWSGIFLLTTQMSAELVPTFSQAVTMRRGVVHARERTLMAGAAVLAYRAANGRWPDSLQEALPKSAPDLPDPFTGKPLQYRREAAGFVVFSVGPKGHFDGGHPGMKPPKDQAYFRYP